MPFSKYPSPNWSKWRLYPEWSLLQASALSLDIDPDIDSNLLYKLTFFRDRLDVLHANYDTLRRSELKPNEAYVPYCNYWLNPLKQETCKAFFAKAGWQCPEEMNLTAPITVEDQQEIIKTLEAKIAKLEQELMQLKESVGDFQTLEPIFNPKSAYYPPELHLAIQIWDHLYIKNAGLAHDSHTNNVKRCITKTNPNASDALIKRLTSITAPQNLKSIHNK